MSRGQKKSQLEADKKLMLEHHLKARGISDPRILAAFQKLPRENFVASNLREKAYQDQPLSIGHQVTISQPYIVALTLQEARPKPKDVVLEIGTGSGYQTALLADLDCVVHSIELIPELSIEAQERLGRLGYKNVKYHIGDGHLGWPEPMLFDLIILSAAPIQIPQTLLNQLKVGGRLIGPAGPTENQWLYRYTRETDSYVEEKLTPVRFVSMNQSETTRSF